MCWFPNILGRCDKSGAYRLHGVFGVFSVLGVLGVFRVTKPVLTQSIKCGRIKDSRYSKIYK